ncbi:MAG: glycosyltransferase family 2 protein [Actinomycetota bacterium]
MSLPAGDLPIVSVVITTHDRPELAQRALASALAQTRPDVEVLVVDDGSDPPFVPGVEDARVRVIRHEHAGGVCRARNAGLAEAQGRFVTFLDDDDVLVPEMVEQCVRAADESALPPPVAVMATVMVLDLEGREADAWIPPTELPRGEDFFLEGKGAAGRAANSLVAPTEVLRAIGGWDEALEAFQHDDLGLRLNAVASIQGVTAPLYRMSTHRAPRVSARWSAIPADMERTLAKHPDAFARHRKAHARFLGALGYYHLNAGHWKAGIRWSVRGVRRNPRDRRNWFFLATCVAGPGVLRGFRRVRPQGSGVSLWTLNRRRARKYLRRLADYPRALYAAPVAAVTRAAARRRVRAQRGPSNRSALVLGVYRFANAPTVGRLVEEAAVRGWAVRLWALDRTAPSLAAVTVGEGAGAKFPLLNRLVADGDPTAFEWVVVVDDDFVFTDGSLSDLLAVAEAAELDLVQPAHTERSHRDIEFTVRRSFSLARRTTFVEIGPAFAFRPPWVAEILPFPDRHTMGWGLELDWFDLAERGARLGIVDSVPIRHLGRVGRAYAKDEQRAALAALLRARGLDSLHDIQRTLGTWRSWQSVPDWANGAAPTVPPASPPRSRAP